MNNENNNNQVNIPINQNNQGVVMNPPLQEVNPTPTSEAYANSNLNVNETNIELEKSMLDIPVLGQNPTVNNVNVEPQNMVNTNTSVVNNMPQVNTVQENIPVSNTQVQMPAPTAVQNNQVNAPVQMAPQVQPNNDVIHNHIPNINHNFSNPVPDGMTMNYVGEGKKKSGGKTLLALLFVLIIGAGGFFGYNYMFSKPYVKVITSFATNLKSGLISVNKLNKLSGNISFESKNKDLSFLNDVTVSYETMTNTNTMEEYANLVYKENDKQIIDLKAYLDKNKRIYLLSKELYDKPLYNDQIAQANAMVEDTTGLTEEDSDYLVDIVMKAIKKVLDDQKPVKSDINLNINGSVKATSNKYTIEMKKLIEIVFTDDKAATILSKLTGTSVSQIKQSASSSTSTDTMELYVYTKGLLNNFVGVAFGENGTKMLEYLTKDDYVLFNMDIDTMKLSAEGKSDNLKYNITSNENVLCTGTFVTYSLGSYGITLEIKDTLALKMTIKRDNGTIDSKAFENAVDMSKLTEEESQKISVNLQQALSKSKIYSLIASENNQTLEEKTSEM